MGCAAPSGLDSASKCFNVHWGILECSLCSSSQIRAYLKRAVLQTAELLLFPGAVQTISHQPWFSEEDKGLGYHVDVIYQDKAKMLKWRKYSDLPSERFWEGNWWQLDFRASCRASPVLQPQSAMYPVIPSAVWVRLQNVPPGFALSTVESCKQGV